MKKALLVIGLLLAARFAGALEHPDQIRYYLLEHGRDPSDFATLGRMGVMWENEDGVVRLLAWQVPGIPRPSESDYVTPAEAAVAALPKKYRKIENGKWVPKSQPEKDDTDAAEKAQKQARKPARQKVLENKYATQVCQKILELANDPRATNQPPAVLTFTELQEVVDNIPENKENKATKIMSKFFAIDAEARQYRTDWFNDVVWNP